MTYTCKICGGRNNAELFSVFGYPILQCEKCDMVFTGITAQKEEQEVFYKNRYYAVANNYANTLKQSAMTVNEDYQELVRTLSKMVRKGRGIVLDIGCAAGAVLSAFKRAGWACHGVEPSTEMATFTRASVGCVVREGLFEAVALPENYYDTITALHVLEHSFNPKDFLSRCHRLLKKDGILLVEVPDFGSRESRRRKGEWLPLYPDTHLYHFTKNTLSRLLGEAGFRVVKVRRFGGLGALSPTVSRTLNKVDLYGNSDNRTTVANYLRINIFRMRMLFYQLPFFKRLLRYLYWHVLGMNDFMRCYARKI